MTGNSFGNLFRLTTFGESHGPYTGGVIDGCPAGLEIDEQFIAEEMARRRPGGHDLVSPRNEPDLVEFVSGIYKGKTTGSPIAFLIRNRDQRPVDYAEAEHLFRPGHADITYFQKFTHYDHRGGGRASARETAARVAAGAVARLLLLNEKITITGYVSAIGNVSVINQGFYHKEEIEKDVLRCPEPAAALAMHQTLQNLKALGETTGGIVKCFIRNLPAGLGEPVFNKLQAVLAYAMMGIPAAKGFEYGDGFKASSMLGSESNDKPVMVNNRLGFETNHAGGILGGISNGADISFSVAFKPVSTIMQPRETITHEGKPGVLQPSGRHDLCVVPRAVPVVEAMAALVVADFLLAAQARS